MARSRLVPGIKVVSYGARSGRHGCWGTGRVYIKQNTPDHRWLIANEYLSSRLATMIGLPTPPGDLGQDYARQPLWITTLVEYDGEPPAPEETPILAAREPDLAAGLLVFDVWVLNVDRHESNVCSHPKLGMWAIDHDQAFAYTKTGNGGSLAECQSEPLRWHLFRNSGLDPSLLHIWGQRVRNVPPSAIKRLVSDGSRRGLYPASLNSELTQFILHRQTQIHRLVNLSLPPAKVQAENDSTDEGGEV